MNRDDLDRILADHASWLGCVGGTRANLGHADLRYTDLRNANLEGVNLGGADLRDTDLRNADLGYANLGHADLRNANLEGVNLRYADLEGARGVVWWQGGAYGPRRRMIRVLGTPDGPIVVAGCLSGTADEVKARLRGDRYPAWAGKMGEAVASAEMADAFDLIDMGVRSVKRRMANDTAGVGR